jgi:hypothetical protein
VATDLTRDELRRLARLGAQTRIEELSREIAAIRAAFPDIAEGGASRGGRRGRKRGRAAKADSPDTGAKRKGRKARRRRAPMSAAKRRAVSERMKKYWAERRKAKE